MTLVLWWRTGADAGDPSEKPSNPLQVRPALEMAALFQVVLVVVDMAHRFFGDSGLLISGAVLGLTDVDALTISIARMPAAGITPNVAAEAIAIGILANCVLKLSLAVVYGTPAFRRLTSAALATMAVAIAAALGVIR